MGLPGGAAQHEGRLFGRALVLVAACRLLVLLQQHAVVDVLQLQTHTDTQPLAIITPAAETAL